MLKFLAKRIWYRCFQSSCLLIFIWIFRFRCYGQSHIPKDGGVMIVSNHQSHLDPVIVGCSCFRHLNYLARKTLFNIKPLGFIIDLLDAIPIDRDGVGLAGLKEMMRRLKKGKMVLIFPEGTRSVDGKLAPLKPGFIAIAKKTKVPIAPVGIAGSFDAWPRTANFPRVKKLCVQFGEPIMAEEYSTMNDQQIVDEVQRRMQLCLDQANQFKNRNHTCKR